MNRMSEDAAAMRQMAATLSHEIRGPLNAIVGTIAVLEHQLSGCSRDRVHLDRLKRNSRHLTAMLDDVLELLRAGSGQFSVLPAPHPLHQAIDDALAEVRWRAEAKGVALDVVAAGGTRRTYWGDPRRVRQIVVNLLNNAIKFTPAGGRVTVEHGVDGDIGESTSRSQRVFIRVTDTGRGIPANRLNAIFEPFQQVDASDEIVGTGLGLAISREFAQAMSGHIACSSTPGVGSAFTLWLRPGTAA